MSRLIYSIATSLHNSPKYQNTKSFFRSLLNDIHYPYKKYFDLFMIILIMVSVSILVLDKSGKVPEWLIRLDLYFVTSIFALEYLLRLWISHDIHKIIVSSSKDSQSKTYRFIFWSKLRYMFSLPALIDFIAIFPKFRIIRLLKLYHYMHGASSLFDALLKKRFEFIFLGYMLFAITFTLGSIFYLLEFGINESLKSYLDAIYWALITISTVGYGDISPVTEAGKIIAMLGIVFGIAMISFVTSVMVSAFSERFDELRNQDNIRHANKMHNVVLINGYGHLGAKVAKKLKINKNYEPVILEDEEHKALKAFEDGHTVIRADGSSAKIIKALYQKDNISAMLTLRSSDIENIYFILNAKSIYADAVVFSRINQPQLKIQYGFTKVNGTIELYDVANKRAFDYLLKRNMEEQKSIALFGYTHKSIYLYKMLQSKGVDIEVYDLNKASILQAEEEGLKNVQIVDIHESYTEMLKYDIVICAMNDEAINVYTAITLKANGFDGEIVALSDSKEDNRKLLLAGVSRIFDMYEESASLFVDMIEKYEK